MKIFRRTDDVLAVVALPYGSRTNDSLMTLVEQTLLNSADAYRGVAKMFRLGKGRAPRPGICLKHHLPWCFWIFMMTMMMIAPPLGHAAPFGIPLSNLDPGTVLLSRVSSRITGKRRRAVGEG